MSICHTFACKPLGGEQHSRERENHKQMPALEKLAKILTTWCEGRLLWKQLVSVILEISLILREHEFLELDCKVLIIREKEGIGIN